MALYRTVDMSDKSVIDIPEAKPLNGITNESKLESDNAFEDADDKDKLLYGADDIPPLGVLIPVALQVFSNGISSY